MSVDRFGVDFGTHYGSIFGGFGGFDVFECCLCFFFVFPKKSIGIWFLLLRAAIDVALQSSYVGQSAGALSINGTFNQTDSVDAKFSDIDSFCQNVSRTLL